MMRVAVAPQYGPRSVVQIVERAQPTPRFDEVVVRVEAVAVTVGDARIRGARFPAGFGVLARLGLGVTRPRVAVLGSAFSGIVTEVGSGVDGFARGDEVAGMAGARMGMHAEHAAVRVRGIAHKPAGVSHADAAGVLFGGTTALYFLRDIAAVAPGSSVLVNGAAGSVGSAAVQLAKHFGATVTAVTSPGNAALVRRLGADRVIDYTSEPLTGRYDIVLDAVGNLGRNAGSKLTTENGTLLLVVGSLADSIPRGGRVRTGTARERSEDMALLLKLVDEKVLDPVTEVVGGLDAVVVAHERVDSGRKVGNLVIRPGA